MTRTVYYTATTLDGYLADENDSLEWLFVQEQEADGPMNYNDFIKGVGAMVMGATTYAWVRAHLERTGEEWSYTIPCWVFTHREFLMTYEVTGRQRSRCRTGRRRRHAGQCRGQP